MSNPLGILEAMVSAALAKEQYPTPDHVRAVIELLRVTPLCDGVSDSEAEQLARLMEERLGVQMNVGVVLTDSDFRPWLHTAQAEIDPYYWSRYRRLLVDEGKPSSVVTALDRATDRVLGLLGDPRNVGQWNRRGMVVGHVQSGKTANYIGLICKAADAGYKLIVVIAGIHNNLRNQTQTRIDEGFIGRDSARLLSRKGDRFVGVGRFDQLRRPVTFTNSLRDFNKVMATGLGLPLENLNEPVVFVIKKNANTLKNLLEWLREHNARSGSDTINEPMLLIDDEADNASINVKHGSGGVTRINEQIRELLNVFARSCYVGYTATPFANIFIDPDTDDEMLGADLFPRNFIASLDPPSNYVGPNRVFLDESAQFIRTIDDHQDTLPLEHKIDHDVRSLPPSLKTAIKAFVIAKAIRLSRGHRRAHCSMLVNASRFTGVQTKLRGEIHYAVDAIKARVRIYGSLPWSESHQDDEMRSLHAVWEKEYADAAPWDVVQRHLHDAAASISVVEVNSRSSGALNYADHADSGLSVIAVGGYSLSRGLTLEGLMISYFLRSSVMYDTLLQMGRWFGYRPDYEDLCRVWMPEQTEGWYAHIAESVELLRAELRTMEAANATPSEFGLKVRSHPDTLIVTARNKMGSSKPLVVKIGLGNQFVETAILRRDNDALKSNREAASRLGTSLAQIGCPPKSATRAPTGWLLRGVPAQPVIDFLAAFQNHHGSVLTDGDPIRRYIEDRIHDELAQWDILFASTREGMPDTLTEIIDGLQINCQRRTAGAKTNSETLYITNKQRVSSRGVERTGLTDAEIEHAQAGYRQAEGLTGEKTPNYPDRIYRQVRQRPLLIVHLLKVTLPDSENAKLEIPSPVVAWGISFPVTRHEEKKVEYIVNQTWLRENFGADLDEDELRGDDV